MSPIQEAAIKMALEALHSIEWHGGGSAWILDDCKVEDAITALKAALAEPQEPPTDWEAVAADQAMTIAMLRSEEPVAWMVYTLDGKSVCVTDNPADFTDEHRVLPLFSVPPQRPPLSDDDIKRIDDGTMFHESSDWSLRFARAIEQAHGIS